MGLWDSLTGRTPSQSSSSSENLQDSAPTTTFAESSQPSYQAQDVSGMLSGASLPDPTALHPLAGLNSGGLDYLTLDDSTISDLPGGQSALPSRGWSDDLCYGAGTTYVAALGVGGVWGMAEGLRKLPPTAPPKLRLNSVLNSMTRRGPFLGNSAGVVAIVYNLVNSGIGHFRGKHDATNSILAGAISGAVFKSTRGLRPMMISSGVVASVAGTWAVSALVRDSRLEHVCADMCTVSTENGVLMMVIATAPNSQKTTELVRSGYLFDLFLGFWQVQHGAYPGNS
jgi:import inner membrane translocase subunit TIM23